MKYYLLRITQCDGIVKMSTVKFDDVDTVEYHAQLLIQSAGIEAVDIVECADYLHFERTVNANGVLDLLMLG